MENLTPMTPTLEAAFRTAREAAEAKAGDFDGLLDHCPLCGPDQPVHVVQLVGMDGRTYEGQWRLEKDGFAWGADSNDDGSSEEEVAECTGCHLRRPLSDYVLYQHA